MSIIIKDLRGYIIYIPSHTFDIVEHLKIFINSVYSHIEPYLIQVCCNGVYLNQFDKLPKNKIIYVWQIMKLSNKYKVSHVFDALSQINGVSYTNVYSDSDSEESFYSTKSGDIFFDFSSDFYEDELFMQQSSVDHQSQASSLPPSSSCQDSWFLA